MVCIKCQMNSFKLSIKLRENQDYLEAYLSYILSIHMVKSNQKCRSYGQCKGWGFLISIVAAYLISDACLNAPATTQPMISQLYHILVLLITYHECNYPAPGCFGSRDRRSSRRWINALMWMETQSGESFHKSRNQVSHKERSWIYILGVYENPHWPLLVAEMEKRRSGEGCQTR